MIKKQKRKQKEKKMKKIINNLAIIAGLVIFAAEGDARWFPVQLLAGAVAFGIIALKIKAKENQ